ncbi:MAG: hypothetical protein MUC59_09245, partial [Saprospiraceae bacterium]|nr:hypothetical protein [Saprospiraceae bacterium]
MENNLDKYFRDNLSNRKFEPSEADWLGAEQLLEANERRRKRRGLIWWFAGGGLVLGLMVTALFLLNYGDKKDAHESPVSIAQGAGETPTNSSIVVDEQGLKNSNDSINIGNINSNNKAS